MSTIREKFASAKNSQDWKTAQEIFDELAMIARIPSDAETIETVRANEQQGKELAEKRNSGTGDIGIKGKKI